MSSSLFITGLGFMIAWLGAVMVYFSLRTEPSDLDKRGLTFLKTTLTKVNESRRLIKFVIVVSIAVTGLLYAASWLGLLSW